MKLSGGLVMFISMMGCAATPTADRAPLENPSAQPAALAQTTDAPDGGSPLTDATDASTPAVAITDAGAPVALSHLDYKLETTGKWTNRLSIDGKLVFPVDCATTPTRPECSKDNRPSIEQSKFVRVVGTGHDGDERITIFAAMGGEDNGCLDGFGLWSLTVAPQRTRTMFITAGCFARVDPLKLDGPFREIHVARIRPVGPARDNAGAGIPLPPIEENWILRDGWDSWRK